jgi:cell division protein FtsW (lipid II flippase)
MMSFARSSRVLGIAAAICAVALGLLYMGLAGAPARLLLINSAALGIGLVLLVLVKMLSPVAAGLRGQLLIGLSLILLATALAGVTVEGATRWLVVGGLSVQPGLLLAPLLVIAYASRCDRWSATALIVAVIATALQPDRAVAAMLLSGVVAAALSRLDRARLGLCAIAAIGFAATLLRPDNLPAMPYVDQILYTSIGVHPLAGIAVWVGTCLLFAPLLPLVVQPDWRGQPAIWAFAAVWGTAVLAAALGNYPTPLVGYGGSAIIGYVLSLALVGSQEAARAVSPPDLNATVGRDKGSSLHFA